MSLEYNNQEIPNPNILVIMIVKYPVPYLLYKSYNWLVFESVNLSKLRVKGLRNVLIQIHNYIAVTKIYELSTNTHNT